MNEQFPGLNLAPDKTAPASGRSGVTAPDRGHAPGGHQAGLVADVDAGTQGEVGVTAAGLLAVPVVTDSDVLARVTALIEPARRQDRTMWLFFLQDDGLQANLLVPISDVPELPAAPVVANVCYVAAQSVAQAPGLDSVVIALSRPGTLRRTESDRHILRALQHGAARHAAPVRMLVLATPEGVRELGPVSPSR